MELKQSQRLFKIKMCSFFTRVLVKSDQSQFKYSSNLTVCILSGLVKKKKKSIYVSNEDLYRLGMEN